MEFLISLIAAHGAWVYALLFAYAAFKSGSLPLFAGYAAQVGALDIGFVIAASLSGTFLGDEIRFAAGRRWGANLVDRFPKLTRQTGLVLRLIERHCAFYILGYRFAKGLRTIGALPVGMTAMSWMTFSPLNLIASLLWAIVVIGLGYGVGSLLDASWGLVGRTAPVLLLVIYVGGGWLVWRQAMARMVRDGA